MKRLGILTALFIILGLSTLNCSGAGSNDDDGNADGVWTDSTTGLMWQNGDKKNLDWKHAKSYCENLNWGGYSDWRLPSISELRSLIRGCDATEDGGECGVKDGCSSSPCWGDEESNDHPCMGCGGDGPGPDGKYWPAEITGSGDIYWSSTTVSDQDDRAWIIVFANGRLLSEEVDADDIARCVRLTSDFSDDDTVDDDTAEEIWTDSYSDLTWQKDVEINMDWEEAMTYCENLDCGGYDDWRLPTISELRSLIRWCAATESYGSCGVTDSCLDMSCYNEFCSSCSSGDGGNNGCYGPLDLPGECDSYWSSSVAYYVNTAWLVFFGQGWVEMIADDELNHSTRCVRGAAMDNNVIDDVWIDPSSNLAWQVNPPARQMPWSNAINYCDSVVYTENEDWNWHLPTISELRSAIRGCEATETGGSCGVTDECFVSSCFDESCRECTEGNGPADGCYWPSEFSGSCEVSYWSMSEENPGDNTAWRVYFYIGGVIDELENDYLEVRCVHN